MKLFNNCLVFMLLLSAVYGAQIPEVKVEGELWAVIVAGSSGWSNYGDQASACHSYHLLRDNGILEDHIILMMYDDIAFHQLNPNPGVLINEPNGPNVYDGVTKDYVKNDVTPENFLKVLSGDEEGLYGVGTGRVVKSGPNDRIFVYINDHGGPGLFCFPYDDLYATDLADVILNMHTNNTFKEMVMYMDSCYSGSMFQDIYPDDIGFYAMTSANEEESAYNCCYDEQLDTYLAAEFGLAWMKNTEWSGVTNQTVGDQYDAAVGLVESSHVMKYGQMNIQNELLSVFLGPGPQGQSPNPFPGICPEDAVKSDLFLATLTKRLELVTDVDERDYIRQQIALLLQNRHFVKDVTERIVMTITKDEKLTQTIMGNVNKKITNRGCYESAAKAFTKNCFNLSENSYALQMLPSLHTLCENGYRAEDIVDATKAICTFPKTTGIH